MEYGKTMAQQVFIWMASIEQWNAIFVFPLGMYLYLSCETCCSCLQAVHCSRSHWPSEWRWSIFAPFLLHYPLDLLRVSANLMQQTALGALILESSTQSPLLGMLSHFFSTYKPLILRLLEMGPYIWYTKYSGYRNLIYKNQQLLEKSFQTHNANLNKSGERRQQLCIIGRNAFASKSWNTSSLSIASFAIQRYISETLPVPKQWLQFRCY